MKKLYKVFISYRQPYKTRRWWEHCADFVDGGREKWEEKT